MKFFGHSKKEGNEPRAQDSDVAYLFRDGKIRLSSGDVPPDIEFPDGGYISVVRENGNGDSERKNDGRGTCVQK